MYSHIGCICLTFLHCAFSDVSSNCLHCMRGCKLTSVAYVWSFSTVLTNVSLNWLPVRMQSHIGYIYLTFLCCVSSNVFSNCLPGRMQSHIGCICLIFPHCVSSDVSSNELPERMHSHIGLYSFSFKLRKTQDCKFRWTTNES